MADGLSSEQAIDFELTDDMKMLKQSVREFALAEILPNVMKYDEVQETL